MAAWQKVAGKKIQFELLDLTNEYDRLVQLLLKHKPDAVVHFAEQRSAPYSMKTPATRCVSRRSISVVDLSKA